MLESCVLRCAWHNDEFHLVWAIWIKNLQVSLKMVQKPSRYKLSSVRFIKCWISNKRLVPWPVTMTYFVLYNLIKLSFRQFLIFWPWGTAVSTFFCRCRQISSYQIFSLREILKLVKSCCELADHKWLRSKVEEVLNSLNCCNQPESKSLSIRIRLEKADLPQYIYFLKLRI